jgi:putative DNA primase/helicase
VSSFETIPAELRERRQWVTWRNEVREGKPTKVPYSALGAQAKTDDPATWATFEQALEAAPTADGIGFVFAADDPFTGVDLDGCRDPETGLVDAKTAALVQQLDSYTETSPSGRGLHIILRAKKPDGRSRNGRVELYDERRYFTFTGEHVPGTPTSVEERQAALDALHAELFPARPKPAPPRNVAPLETDDEELLTRARAARNGSDFERLWRGDTSAYAGDDSRADLALCGALAFWTGPDPGRIDSLFRRSGLMREKWDARRGESTYGAETIARAFERRTEFYEAKAGVTPAPPTLAAARREGESLKVVRFTDVRARSIEWLVDGLVPRRRTTLLYGLEGIGKGLFWNHLCAELSREELTSLVFCTEDRYDEDVLPRFIAAGGDRRFLAYVEIEAPAPGEPPRQLDLARDPDFFEDALRETGAALAVVDPLVGQINVGFDADKGQHVRAFMNPLDAVSAKHDAALLGVVHLNRALSNDPLRRVSASKALRELARSTLILGNDPEDWEGATRVLALDKTNVGEAPSRRYRIERLLIEVDGVLCTTARLAYVGECEVTAPQLLAPPDANEQGELNKATKFVSTLLAEGPVLASKGLELAEAADIAERTLRRARESLGVVARNDGGQWKWHPPTKEEDA